MGFWLKKKIISWEIKKKTHDVYITHRFETLRTNLKKILEISIKCSDPKLVAEKFNDYFSNIALKIDSNFLCAENASSYHNDVNALSCLHFYPASQNEFGTTINNLKNSHSDYIQVKNL